MTRSTRARPRGCAAHNDRTAFRLLLEHGPLSRSRLGELSGLSKPTAAQMIPRLERVGLIEADGRGRGDARPERDRYGVRRDVMTGVAISILADTIEAVAHRCRRLRSTRRRSLPIAGVERSPEDDVQRRRRRRVRRGGRRRARRSASSSSACRRRWMSRPTSSRSPTRFRAGRSPARGGASRRRLGMTVIARQRRQPRRDGRARARRRRRTRRASRYFWIGEGLGVGLDIDGQIQRGTSGSAGEIGYLEVPRSAAAHRSRRARTSPTCSAARRSRALVGDRRAAAARRARPSVGADDPAWASVADRVALALAPIVALLDPASIVLGGPTGVAGGERLAELVQHAHRRRRSTRSSRPHVRTGAHRCMRGARGASRPIRDQLEADIPLAPDAASVLVAHVRDPRSNRPIVAATHPTAHRHREEDPHEARHRRRRLDLHARAHRRLRALSRHPAARGDRARRPRSATGSSSSAGWRSACSPAPGIPAASSRTSDLRRRGRRTRMPCSSSCASAARTRGTPTRPGRTRCDCIGQETTGPGGLAKALRTVPVVLRIADDGARAREARTPGSSTSPTRSASSRAPCSQAGHRAVGLCNVAIGFQRRFAAMLGVDRRRGGARPRRPQPPDVGAQRLGRRGATILPDLLARPARRPRRRRARSPPRCSRSSASCRRTTCATTTRTTRCCASSSREPSRAEAVRAIERELLALYADPSRRREARGARAARRRVLLRGGRSSCSPRSAAAASRRGSSTCATTACCRSCPTTTSSRCRRGIVDGRVRRRAGRAAGRRHPGPHLGRRRIRAARARRRGARRARPRAARDARAPARAAARPRRAAHRPAAARERAGSWSGRDDARSIVAVDGGGIEDRCRRPDPRRRGRRAPARPRQQPALRGARTLGRDRRRAGARGRGRRAGPCRSTSTSRASTCRSRSSAYRAAVAALPWAAARTGRSTTTCSRCCGPAPTSRTPSPSCAARGINAVGVRADGATVRFPSLGPLSGDWGGGSGLGPEALWYAARDVDGRGRAHDADRGDLRRARRRLDRRADRAAALRRARRGRSLRARARRSSPRPRRAMPSPRGLVDRQADEIVAFVRAIVARLDLAALALPGRARRQHPAGAGTPMLDDRIAAGIAAVAPRARIVLPDAPPILGAAIAAAMHAGAAARAAVDPGACASSPTRGAARVRTRARRRPRQTPRERRLARPVRLSRTRRR